MGLATPPKIQELQRKLGDKAKREPDFRFYTLYDKVYRPDVLEHAYHLCKSNGGASGVDGKSFEDIEAYGAKRFLAEIEQELKEETYRPDAVKRVMIPKPNGGERPLGIPTIKDRTVQAAVKLIIEPIFEMDFTSNAHGYRPGHSAGQAIQEVQESLRAGYTDVVDADLSKYFDTIPHAELMRSVARRVADGSLLRLIKLWLEAPIEETDERGKRNRRLPGSRGTPQGGVLSPLLANIYMRRFLITWEQRGYGDLLQTRIANYADDFVILCRGTARQALSKARDILTRIGLTLNEEKTRVCNAWHESFNFLGFTFGKRYSRKTGRPYLSAQPSEKSVQKLKDRIRDMTTRASYLQSVETLVATLNMVLRGWAAYFRLESWHDAFRAVDKFVFYRFARWLARKHKGRGWGTNRYPARDFYGHYGLLRLTTPAAAPRTP